MIAPSLPQIGLSVAQASKLIGVSRYKGYELIHKGKLRAFRDSQGLIKIDPNETQRYLREEAR